MSSAGARSLSAPPHPGEKGQVRAGTASSQGWGGTTWLPTQQSGRGGMLRLEDAARAWGPTAIVGSTPAQVCAMWGLPPRRPGLCRRGVTLPLAPGLRRRGVSPSPRVCDIMGSPPPLSLGLYRRGVPLGSLPLWGLPLALALGLYHRGVSLPLPWSVPLARGLSVCFVSLSSGQIACMSMTQEAQSLHLQDRPRAHDHTLLRGFQSLLWELKYI